MLAPGKFTVQTMCAASSFSCNAGRMSPNLKSAEPSPTIQSPLTDNVWPSPQPCLRLSMLAKSALVAFSYSFCASLCFGWWAFQQHPIVTSLVSALVSSLIHRKMNPCH